jgi:hypothetical protein
VRLVGIRRVDRYRNTVGIEQKTPNFLCCKRVVRITMAKAKQREPNGIAQIVSDMCGDLVCALMPLPIFLLVMGIFIVWVSLRRVLYSA